MSNDLFTTLIFWFAACAVSVYVALEKGKSGQRAKWFSFFLGWIAMCYYLFSKPYTTKNWNLKKSWRTLGAFFGLALLITIIEELLILQ